MHKIINICSNKTGPIQGCLLVHRYGTENQHAKEFKEYDTHCLDLIANAIGYTIQKFSSIQDVESFLKSYDNIFRIIMSTKSNKEIWDEIAILVRDEMKCEACSIFFYEDDYLILKGTTGIKGNLKYSDVKYNIGEGLTGQSFLADDPIVYYAESSEKYKHHISKYSEVLRSDKSKSVLYIQIKDIYETNINLKVFDLNNLKKDWEKNISGLHHELLSPVDGIHSHIEWLLNKSYLLHQNDEIKQKIMIKIDDMQQSCRLIDMLVSSMGHLDVEVIINKRKVAIHEILNTCKTYLNNEATRNKIDIRIEYLGLPKIEADELHLMRVFYNLLRNAIKYSDKSETNRYIKIFGEDHSNFIQIFFEDNGIGINKNETKIIFTKFVRGTNARIAFPEGTGLGLAYCRNIINAHSGKIWVDENHFYKPTILIVRLPKI
jgi:nitrogen-specific signal transduction histidine kinase